MFVSYDYSEMIKEIKEDIADGILSLSSFIFIERGNARLNYNPIIDWYYQEDQPKNLPYLTLLPVVVVLSEMEYMSNPTNNNRDILTLKEVEELYGIKSDTLRSYIARGEVIPKDKSLKIGRQWFIDASYAFEKWGNKR